MVNICDNCLYCKTIDGVKMCERMVPIGGMPISLPKEKHCKEWSIRHI